MDGGVAGPIRKRGNPKPGGPGGERNPNSEKELRWRASVLDCGRPLPLFPRTSRSRRRKEAAKNERYPAKGSPPLRVLRGETTPEKSDFHARGPDPPRQGGENRGVARSPRTLSKANGCRVFSAKSFGFPNLEKGCASCSAGFQSARRAGKSSRRVERKAWQIGNPRYSRLEACATWGHAVHGKDAKCLLAPARVPQPGVFRPAPTDDAPARFRGEPRKLLPHRVRFAPDDAQFPSRRLADVGLIENPDVDSGVNDIFLALTG